jgi:L-amino acid N-acyltransferase YncA
MDIVDAAPRHAAEIADIYAPHVTGSTTSFEATAPDVDEIERRMAANRPWLVAEVDGATIGYSYASSFKEREAYRHTRETTVYVARHRQRQGVATALSHALLDRLAAEGVHVAVAVIALPNPASVATAESVGYVRSGIIPEAGSKHDRWIDIGFWVRLL